MKTLLSRYLRPVFALALMLSASCLSVAGGFTTTGGKIFDATGQEIQIRGINHFGFNAPILQPQFLWSMGWKAQIAQIKSLGFNAVRLPFVPDTLYNTTPVDKLSYVDAGLNPELIGKTPLQALDLWMAEADRQGLYVLLDFHSVSKQRQYPTWYVSNAADYALMYNGQAYTVANWQRDLAFVAGRYAGLSHFMGIDLYNEPNGVVRWAAGDANAANPANYWKTAAEGAAAAVLSANPNLLVFVQGINGNYDGRENSTVPMNWGEDFQPQAYQPLNIPATKLVLSPHTYGPDVFVKSSFSAANFPANLAANWETLFGQFSKVTAVVPGEWGGRFGSGPGGQQDVVWQKAFVDYLLSKGLHNSFYWCYTPNSGDTGGILDDALNVRLDKMALLQRLWGAAPTTAPTTTPVVAPATTANPQQSFVSFAPASGPAGTVVTLQGSGFTGSTMASVGPVRGAVFAVVSDTQLRVTVPANAASGAIGIFNAAHAAFTATSFTVTGTALAALPQQSISSFSPAAGAVGTVVTINGSGLTGSTNAWFGAARNAAVKVLGDTQMQVIVPAGASTGAIGIFNPAHAAFTATPFTVR